ncbi:hypothetical protein PIB30_064550 [Stylosanthes scabra]|uniref:Pectinesterase inhibitor domain-containing protein n=1 Tax=Stylosanthes scabra TaxID=79078 RepID=A0ABU6YJY8_9FABA|nr:hypothetical protein [Stylosanthes scabra]
MISCISPNARSCEHTLNTLEHRSGSQLEERGRENTTGESTTGDGAIGDSRCQRSERRRAGRGEEHHEFLAKVVKVETICNGTVLSSFCSDLLNSKPGGAKGADIDSLAQYTIEVLRSNLTNTVNLLKSLTANSSDHTLVDVYYGCLGNLNVGDGALGEIDPMQRNLKAYDYNAVTFGLNDIIHDNDDCMSNDQESDDPSRLPHYTDDILKVTVVLSLISKYWFSN